MDKKLTHIKLSVLTLSMVCLMSTSTPVLSQDVLGLAGYSGNTDDAHYAYAGLIAPLPVGQNQDGNLGKNGFLLRLWGAWLAYDYDSGAPANQTIDVDGPIGEIGLGYHFVGTSHTSSVYINYVGRSLEDDPDDPFNETVDDNHGLKFQGDTDFMFNQKLGVNLNGSYTAFLDDYWFRGRPFYKFDNSSLRIGPEVIALGGERYDRIRFGAFISGISLGPINLGLNVGADRDKREDDTHAYFGISFSNVFKF